MIYTTYFSMLRKLPEGIVPIAICGKAPEWYKGLQYKKLAPQYGFFQEWKKTHDNDYYMRRFCEQVLEPLNPDTVVSELLEMANSKDIALVCYEKPTDFCHRHIVRQWLINSGFEAEEWGI